MNILNSVKKSNEILKQKIKANEALLLNEKRESVRKFLNECIIDWGEEITSNKKIIDELE